MNLFPFHEALRKGLNGFINTVTHPNWGSGPTALCRGPLCRVPLQGARQLHSVLGDKWCSCHSSKESNQRVHPLIRAQDSLLSALFLIRSHCASSWPALKYFPVVEDNNLTAPEWASLRSLTPPARPETCQIVSPAARWSSPPHVHGDYTEKWDIQGTVPLSALNVIVIWNN